MRINWAIAIVIFLLSVLLAVGVFVLLHKRMLKSKALLQIIPPTEERFDLECNVKIIIGESVTKPIVTVQKFQSISEYDVATPLDIRSSKINRLTALLQAAPSILIAGESSGKRLMEVVVNGDLARAADGNGLRAFAMGAKGIKEHARLFEVPNLQSMINVAAIWQIASVVVAQKHLADISKKLDEIKVGVLGISKFLDNQRKARIESTYEYLNQVYQTIKSGEIPASVRIQLEICERDLLEIQCHLEKEYRQKIDKKIEHRERFGSEGLTDDIAKKISGLDALTLDMALCIKTRIAAWHVLSLYPGEPQLKIARGVSIKKSIDSFQSLGPYCSQEMICEILEIKSFWNSSSTLAERRTLLSEQCQSTVQKLENSSQYHRDEIKRSDQLMLTHDKPTRIFFQFDGDVLIGAREANT